MDARICIVIVNYRTSDLVIDCLRSVESQAGELGGGRVLVADNASEDGSVETLSAAITAKGWSSWVEVLPCPLNGGFAYGNNACIRAAMREESQLDHVLLLNPDTLVRPGAIRALVEFMVAHPKVGIAGRLIENPNGGVDRTAHRMPSPIGELDGSARLGVLSRLLHRYAVTPPLRVVAHECDWVSGAAMIVRRQVLEQIGLLDEGFFLYFEEVDFCCRARDAGWQVWYVPEARILHLEGVATGIRIEKKRRPSYWYDSRRRFFIKHHDVLGLLVADLLWAVGRVSYLARLALGLAKRSNDPQLFMYDLLWGDMRALLSGQVRAMNMAARQ